LKREVGHQREKLCFKEWLLSKGRELWLGKWPWSEKGQNGLVKNVLKIAGRPPRKRSISNKKPPLRQLVLCQQKQRKSPLGRKGDKHLREGGESSKNGRSEDKIKKKTPWALEPKEPEQKIQGQMHNTLELNQSYAGFRKKSCSASS